MSRGHRLLSDLDGATAALVGLAFARQETVAVEGPDGRPIARIVPAHPHEGRTLAEMIAERPDLGRVRVPEGFDADVDQAIDWLGRCPHCGARANVDRIHLAQRIASEPEPPPLAP